MFLWAGLHQACISNHSGAVKDLKFGRNERIYVYFEVIMFFRKDPPQTEGRRHAHLRIKSPPALVDALERGRSDVVTVTRLWLEP